jgi:uncharacterized protein YjbI with pentapeptide repeats
MRTQILSLSGNLIDESDTLNKIQLVEQNKHKLHYADLCGDDLNKADLSGADLSGANLRGANLYESDLRGADLTGANLTDAYLRGANLSGADLSEANLHLVDLYYANLNGADLTGASLIRANFYGAELTNTIGLIKPMGVKPGNIYWKRLGPGLINFDYQFNVGLNELRPGEVFASDERLMCSYSGFHFASRKWCDKYYSYRPYEAKIRIPLDAKINEPWGTDGKASADKIEILQVFDTRTGEDVTDQFRK